MADLNALKEKYLADGTIDDAEARELRAEIFADGKIDDDEKQLLRDLKAGAKSVGPEFQKLYEEVIGK